ncbi:hypothetical protein WT61_03490 [Burkholderia stagnalis]|nr:hypothetical protein WT61_03490 [Burkholderia stagnalis]KWH57533.1 hypothetical protein WT62_28950 [Burkholderia stagnalis]
MHPIRNSLDFVSWKDRKAAAAALKEVYRAPTAEAAAVALDVFDAGPIEALPARFFAGFR